MKAIVCHAFGEPDDLALEDIAEPEPGDGEVLIRVRAAALNFFDTLMIRGKYQHKPEHPFSPGGEVAGEIERLGPGVTGLEVGQRVMAHVRWNGCREKTVAKASAVVQVPPEVIDEIAAGVTITYGTAMHGLKDRGRIAPGETVAVLGASGGAGLAAVEIAKALRARVIAVASLAEKLAVCQTHGADDLINYSSGDLRDQLKAATGGRGVDIVYDCVGGSQTERALRALAWDGRLLVVGFASGEIPHMPLNLPLLKGCSIVGVMFGRFAELFPETQQENMRQVLQWCANGTLKPHVQEVVPLEETIRALKMIDARQAVGKIVVRP
ncbi:NADPH:quinone oxidoreductase family protein [Dichotomicrobium thermohalophilum]|uniref:NADPH2:quinone reductase n=1 Tax=Dichotomicrobium thermohalophilum TaxID=933063 RepID=A0A397PNB8_9HYPH|nr:NADPH:quinone oxidoreductase family protein [Dichotomicrobium thermohalophilum]RIA47241.1 NADPH2:quinone reductase [Dichotomicrobium thermohalophilum]